MGERDPGGASPNVQHVRPPLNRQNVAHDYSSVFPSPQGDNTLIVIPTYNETMTR